LNDYLTIIEDTWR